MVIREQEYVFDTDIFDTAEGDCLFNDDVVTADMEAGYVDLMECIHYHNNVTCVKLGEIIEEQLRKQKRQQVMLYTRGSRQALHMIHA